jgi:diaminopimelate epimerase
VRFVHDQGLTDKREIRVETMKRHHRAASRRRWQCHGRHGNSPFLPAEIPFLHDDDVVIYSLDVADETLEISVVSMGNPHAVQVVASVDSAPVGEHGPLIENHRVSRSGSTPASCRWSISCHQAARL